MKVLIVAGGWLGPITLRAGTMATACSQCWILKSSLVTIHARYGANYGETFVDRHLLGVANTRQRLELSQAYRHGRPPILNYPSNITYRNSSRIIILIEVNAIFYKMLFSLYYSMFITFFINLYNIVV